MVHFSSIQLRCVKNSQSVLVMQWTGKTAKLSSKTDFNNCHIVDNNVANDMLVSYTAQKKCKAETKKRQLTVCLLQFFYLLRITSSCHRKKKKHTQKNFV